MAPQRSALLVVGAVALLAACSDNANESSDTVAVVTNASTVAEPTTTATVLATTTTARPVSLVLREGGLGYFDFGDQPQAVIDDVSSVLGAPISDAVIADTFSFSKPSGRSVCWSVGLCTTFGGPDVANELFVGWSYWDDETAALSTAYGVTIGKHLEDDDRIILEYLRPCYNGIDGLEAFSFLDENEPVITVHVSSEGIPFTREGNLAGPYAPPEQLVIVGLSAGHNPSLSGSECGSDRSAR